MTTYSPDISAAFDAMKVGNLPRAGHRLLAAYRLGKASRGRLSGNLEDIVEGIVTLAAKAPEAIPWDARCRAAVEVIAQIQDEVRSRSQEHAKGSMFDNFEGTGSPGYTRAMAALLEAVDV